MRIAFVSEYPDRPEAVVGGVQAVVRQLATGMARRPGLEVHVVAPGVGDRISPAETMEGVEVHRIPATVRLGNLTMGRAERRFTVDALKRRSSPNCTSCRRSPGPRGSRISRRRRTRLLRCRS